MGKFGTIVPLTWDVRESLIQTESGTKIKGYKALERSDNGNLLSVVKSSYSPMLNSDLISLVQEVSEISGFKQKEIVEWEGGKKIICHLEGKPTKIGDWKFENFMLIGNAHDYSSTLFLGTTNVMVRCTNQFSRIAKRLSIRHTKTKEAKIQDLKIYMQIYTQLTDALHADYNKMVKVKVDERVKHDMIKFVLSIDKDSGSKIGNKFDYSTIQEVTSTRKANQYEEVLGAIEKEMNDVGKNMFGLFNGVTYWTTHQKESKQKTFGNVFGNLAYINNRAMKFAMAEVGN